MLQLDQAVDVRSDLAAPSTPAPEALLRSRFGDLQLTIGSDLAALEAEWRRFEQVADCTVFQSFDWLSSWLRHVGSPNGVTPAIAVGRRGGQTACILPLGIEAQGGVRRLGFLGRELGDYNAPLLAPGFARLCGDFPALWRAIRGLLQAHPRYRHDLIVLDKMPELIGAQANPLLQLKVNRNPSGAYAMQLGDAWETFYAAKRSSATRRRDRTKRKRLGEGGELRMVSPQTVEDIAHTLDLLFAQKRNALARMGVEDVFARPGYHAFFRALATAPSPRIAHVSRLDIGQVPAATNLGLHFRGTYSHLIASYDDGPLARFGPGAAHLHELMRYAIEHGCTTFDFTIGDEPYKRDWCDSDIKLYDHVSAATLRGAVAAAPVAALRALKRRIKQSPVFWPLLLRGRATAARLRRRSARPAAGTDG